MSPTSTLTVRTLLLTVKLPEGNHGRHRTACPLNHIAAAPVVHLFEELAEVSARLQGGDVFRCLHTRTTDD
jgi:hypothetical protein